jgi:APA family basic amino acid/polyamine antiporter
MTHATPTADQDAGLRRVLGRVSATNIVIGAIIGVGIFFTPTSVARIAGNGQLAMWTWAAGGAVALLGALTFAELGGMYGRTGGQYDILRDSYGPLVAFCFVFCNSTAIVAGGVAIISMVCAENLAALVAGSVPAAPVVAGLAVVLIALLAAANFIGVRWGAAIQNVTVFAKVAALALIALLAAFAGRSAGDASAAAQTTNAATPWIALLFAGLVPALFAYGGWQHVLWMGGEVKDPRRNLPFAIVVGVLVVMAVYLSVNWAYLHLLGYAGVSSSRALASDAVSVAWPRVGARFVAGAVALSAFGVLNEQILAGPRLLFGMARDGRFFALFGRAHRRFATPGPAIVLMTALAVTLVLVAGKNGIDRLLTGVVLVDAVFFALTGAALIVLRIRQPDADRPMRVPLYPVVPALFVLLEAAIIFGAFQIQANRAAAWIGVIWVGVALGCYGLFFRGKNALASSAASS